MSVLVTGGAGYIGSHTAVRLLRGGYDILIADNFSNSSPAVLPRIEKITGKKVPFEFCDVSDSRRVEKLFSLHHRIDRVIHFAAYKAVGESVAEPLKYYRNNLEGLISILERMERHGVKNFVFSSSATVYGDPEKIPCDEGRPVRSATNPYGQTKIMSERILTDLSSAKPDMNIAILRYFNPIGAHPSGLIGEDPEGVPNNLVPYVARAAMGIYPAVRVYGDDYPTPDGTGIRDYIHVMDLAEGHLAALEKLKSGCGLVIYNLGTGRGYSVLEVVKAYERACGKKIRLDIQPRRPGDIAACWADPSKAERELGWKAKYNLEDMCAHSWNWQTKNPKGYRE